MSKAKKGMGKDEFKAAMVVAQEVNHEVEAEVVDVITDEDLELLEELGIETVEAQDAVEAELDDAVAKIARKGVEDTVKKVREARKAKEAKPAVKVDLPALLAKLPAVVRPKDLATLFGYEDGKPIRRVLRSKFAAAHDYRKEWEWKNGDPILSEIVTHFAQNTAKQAAK